MSLLAGIDLDPKIKGSLCHSVILVFSAEIPNHYFFSNCIWCGKCLLINGTARMTSNTGNHWVNVLTIFWSNFWHMQCCCGRNKNCIFSFSCKLWTRAGENMSIHSSFLPSLTSILYLRSSSSSERTSFLRLLSSTIRWGEISSSGLWFLQGRQRSSNICHWDVEWWTTPS